MSDQYEEAMKHLEDNGDTPVDVSPPTFNQVAVFQLDDTEVSFREGETVANLTWVSEAALVDNAGKTHPAGTKLRDRLKVDPAPNAKSREQVKKIAIQTADKIIKAAGRSNAKALTAREAINLLRASKGVRMMLTITEKDGFNRIKYSRPA